jgi:hypothetical protein
MHYLLFRIHVTAFTFNSVFYNVLFIRVYFSKLLNHIIIRTTTTISDTTALMGASCHEYGSIAKVSANEGQVASLPPQHTHSNSHIYKKICCHFSITVFHYKCII